MNRFASLIERRAAATPGGESHVILDARGREVLRLEWTGFADRVRRVASSLAGQGLAGRRVLLMCPWGESFVVSVWACLYSGAIPVPAPLETFERSIGRASAIAEAARPAAAIVGAETQALARQAAPGLEFLDYQNLLADSPPRSSELDARSDTAALIQFTSGSTASPRGIVLSADNLIGNCQSIIDAYDLRTEDVGVSWLPMHHDMGLIGHTLVPVFTGSLSVLMPSLGFLQRPERWLQAIDRYRGSVSAAPAFAFEYCRRRARPESLQGLDLACWRVAICGAEPIDIVSLEGFAEQYAGLGFQRQALRPSYGLAEATLLVSAGGGADGPRARTIADNAATPGARIVSCGRAAPQTEIAIVGIGEDRQRSQEVGEIVVRSSGLAAGYLDAAEDKVVGLADRRGWTCERGLRWYRTGDLGFLHDGELHVVGRGDDLLQIRGRNLHVSEVDAVVARAHAVLEQGRCCGIGVPNEGSTAIVVLAEIPRICPQLDDIEPAIRSALAGVLEIVPQAVVLLDLGTLPRTTSGKIRRGESRKQYLAQGFAARARNSARSTAVKADDSGGVRS